jgi:hypothetical protein
MSAEDFEFLLRERMHAHTAEIDRTWRPAPPLVRIVPVRARGERSVGRFALRLALPIACLAVLGVAVVSGPRMAGRGSGSLPTSSIAPSSRQVISATAILSATPPIPSVSRPPNPSPPAGRTSCPALCRI